MKDWKNHRPRDEQASAWIAGLFAVLSIVAVLALVDHRDRLLEQTEKTARLERELAAAQAEAERWECTEFTGRWPIAGQRAKACLEVAEAAP